MRVRELISRIGAKRQGSGVEAREGDNQDDNGEQDFHDWFLLLGLLTAKWLVLGYWSNLHSCA